MIRLGGDLKVAAGGAGRSLNDIRHRARTSGLVGAAGCVRRGDQANHTEGEETTSFYMVGRRILIQEFAFRYSGVDQPPARRPLTAI